MDDRRRRQNRRFAVAVAASIIFATTAGLYLTVRALVSGNVSLAVLHVVITFAPFIAVPGLVRAYRQIVARDEESAGG